MELKEKHNLMLYPTVRVRTEKAGGSGTVIYSRQVPGSPDEYETYVLTNHHVIADNIKVGKKWSSLLKREIQDDVLSECTVEFFEFEYDSWEGGHRSFKGEIMCYDKDMDLGLLRLKSSRQTTYVANLLPKNTHKRRLRIFQKVFAVGCGMGHPPLATEGQLNGFTDVIDNYPYILSSAPTIFGNSGGSLYLAETGELIGVPARITVALIGFGGDAITHLSYAIPIWTVYQFLDEQIFDFIYSSDTDSVKCAEKRRKKRERDEKQRAIDISRGDETDTTPSTPNTSGTSFGSFVEV